MKGVFPALAQALRSTFFRLELKLLGTNFTFFRFVINLVVGNFTFSRFELKLVVINMPPWRVWARTVRNFPHGSVFVRAEIHRRVILTDEK
jgi:hypothetical protein